MDVPIAESMSPLWPTIAPSRRQRAPLSVHGTSHSCDLSRRPLSGPVKVTASGYAAQFCAGLRRQLLARVRRAVRRCRCRWRSRLALLTAIELALIVCGLRRAAVHGPIMGRLTRWARPLGCRRRAATTAAAQQTRSQQQDSSRNSSRHSGSGARAPPAARAVR